MKRVLLSALIVLASLSFVKAQNITVDTTKVVFSVGSKEAFIVKVYETNIKEVTKQWNRFIKDHKGKIAGKDKSEIFGDNVNIKELSNNTCDLYTKIAEKDKYIEIQTAVDLGGAFLTQKSHPEKYVVFQGILKKFAVNASKAGVLAQKKEQEKLLSKKEKELKKLVSEKKKLEKGIEEYKQDIKAKEQAIEGNKKEQELKEREVDDYKSTLGAEMSKDQKKTLSIKEKELKKIKSSKKKIEKEIASDKKKIEKNKNAIKDNEKAQKDAEKEIKTFKEEIDKLIRKEKGIK